MQKRNLAAISAVGLAAAIAVPTIAFGNARRNEGSLKDFNSVSTPFIAQMSGANEVGGGDTDGAGAAAITFEITDALSPTGANVCWDITYTGLTGTPVASHIHRGATGVNGPIVVPAPGVSFPNLTATGTTGCVATDPTVVAEIMATPSNFYVNVHTSDFPGGAIRGQLAKGPAPAGEAHFLPVPLRAYDSRLANGAKIVPFETRTISLATGKDLAGTSSVAVPPGATAAIVTLTVTETGGGPGGNGGFLKLYSAGIPEPATSSINWAGADQNIAVTTQVAVDATGSVKVTDGANATHFVIDVIGYLF